MLLLSLLSPLPCQAEAKIARLCLVAYETQSGYSEDAKVQVTFVTGSELNDATNSYTYQSFSNYALIWFKPEEVAILELDGVLLGVGKKVTNDDFKRLFSILSECSATQINSKPRRNWKIKGKELFSWIDPNVDS